MKIRKIIHFVLVVVLCVQFFPLSIRHAMASEQNAENKSPAKDVSIFQILDESYDEYLRDAQNNRPNVEIIIDAFEYLSSTEDSPEIYTDFMGDSGKSIVTGEDSVFEWEANIPEAGFYNIGILYYPIVGKSSSIERNILINGELPYSIAANVSFPRIWRNETNEFSRDNRDNAIRPRQIENPMWNNVVINDSRGYYNEPLLFYFNQGINTITFESVREPMLIRTIKIFNEPELPDYAEILKEYKNKGYNRAEADIVIVQGETAILKSSPTLYPLNDRSSPATEPYHISKVRMNTIGGNNWYYPNDWIIFEFDIQEDGLYEIGIKNKQNFLRSFNVVRKMFINGETPFKELTDVQFPFNRNWQMKILGDDNPYQFYFTKGTHQIKLQLSLGDVVEVIREIEDCVYHLNYIYRKIIIITGTVPDPYRDYMLERNIPDLKETLQSQKEKLEEIVARLEAVSGQKSDQTAIVQNLIVQLDSMLKRTHEIPKHLVNFKSNIGGLGSMVLSLTRQPLEIDYLVIAPSGNEMPRPDSSWFGKVIHELGAFIASFTEDYNTIGDVEGSEKTIDVWINTGRDQAQVLKSMIDDSFTPYTGIGVNFRLVGADVILPSTLAGRGPDVAMQMANTIPVNYGIRNSLQDLAVFDDFHEIANRFRESALAPYSFNGQVYALPEQQTFPMLFYRKDILDELRLSVPQTWAEVFMLIPELKKKHLDFGFPSESELAVTVPNATFSMLLLQHGGKFYNEQGKSSALYSEESIRAFKDWTDLYLMYKFPVEYDFVNRFRTGEVPIGIADYTTYNHLYISAPEIRGFWSFSPVPGMADSNGNIHREVASGGSAVVIMKSTDDKESAWQYLKWWTSTETQTRFGREMEGILGAAARYPTANVEALELLPWPARDYANLNSQWQWVRGVPEVPGSYFTGRHISNAFNAVVNRNLNYRETLYDYVQLIDDEITVKRQEFNLPVE